MSPVIFISPSALYSIPVEELEKQIALAKEESRRTKLTHELQKLKVITAQYSVNVAPPSSPSIPVASLASSNGVINVMLTSAYSRVGAYSRMGVYLYRIKLTIYMK